ncbi:MAG: pentapeptide repeat-containing protein [Pirellulaceae bacterium]
MANPEHERRLRDAVQAKDPAADLSGCDLSGIRFSSIRIAGAILRGADLRRADLSGGYFRGCDLRESNCSKTRITTSDFREANLAGADLTAADWTGAILTGANLTGANLSRTKLVKARLDGVDLTGANLNGTDLRGVQGLTAAQFASARNSDKAILDERMLASFGKGGDQKVARHGKLAKKRATPLQVDLMFADVKPCFGDVFLLCGFQHPEFPPTGDYGFAELADLGIEQVDDYFALCVEGDPAVWIYPLAQGQEVQHHPGPYDGLRLTGDDGRHKRLWSKCVARFESGLRIPVSK